MDAQVKYLIGQEMSSFEPKDYLASLKAPKCEALSSDLIKQEMERIDRGDPMEQISMKRYELEPPSGISKGDVNEWKEALTNAKAQQAHFDLRLMNLELLASWGAQMHLQTKLVTQKFESSDESKIANLSTRLDSVNKKRKLDQVSWGNDLRKLQYEYDQRVLENGQALQGIKRVKVEIEHLKTVCQDRAVLPEDWIDRMDPNAARLIL